MDRVSAEQDYISDKNFSDHTTTPITDFDAAYNNTGAVANSDSLIASWPEKAAIFRDSWKGAEYDLAYASKTRNRYDMFVPEGTPKGIVVFIHGGYWRRFDKSCFSHLAAGALGQGWRVAIPSYSLAPSARVGEIIAEMCQAVNHICTPLKGQLFWPAIQRAGIWSVVWPVQIAGYLQILKPGLSIFCLLAGYMICARFYGWR